MRFLIQVVTEASVTVNENTAGSIGRGFLVLVGIGPEDTRELADKMVAKMLKLRIFQDDAGKTNLSLKDIGGELLLVSQFTLYADCRHGNRPGFTHAGPPDMAGTLFSYITDKCKESVPKVETGVFGADMKVKLINDGPFTVMLDSAELFPDAG